MTQSFTPGASFVTYSEMQAMRDALLSHIQVAGGLDNAQSALVDILAALYRRRFGPAPGTTATHYASNRVATRYWDAELGRLSWLILADPASKKLTGTRVDALHEQGKGWVLHERPWQELVYRWGVVR